ncbi:hypothetical protein LEP1GSC050_3586 [Leptospira broomii serovar Hurstbridge str. 5399]|uniref:Uncharacterized protein n=1 Tax=Leptospira broomii serovar Hurstbridge str. 5399 TaxID=1049789 RepID=T0F9L1_9LEPT|nr:hypothetical protein [Leptospira broomii]EQA44232.1 hypothetical protein LEP1GSC050_3586 [Leptospira broomii serovar Hurstbridge str. 5399]
MESKREPGSESELNQSLFDGKEDVLSGIDKNPELQNELIRMEESLQAGLKAAEESYFESAARSHAYTTFQEDLDVSKAELTEGWQIKAFPEYLKRYVEMELSRKEQSRESIVVKLGKSGAQLFDSLIQTLQINTRVDYAPAMRSAAAKTPAASEFIVFEEKVEDDCKFTYQVVQETEETAYLSVKIDCPRPEDFQRVNLSKDGRFILSNQFNSDGITNFAGLREGKYTVEFQGKDLSKSIDLFILLD